MLALYNVGPAVEATLGGNRFLAVYLGSAVGGNVLGYLLGSGFSTSMGSSGGVARCKVKYNSEFVGEEHLMQAGGSTPSIGMCCTFITCMSGVP
jgi:hypothetical protein